MKANVKKVKAKTKTRAKKKKLLDNPTMGIMPGETIPDDLIDFCSDPRNIEQIAGLKGLEDLAEAKTSTEASRLIYSIVKACAKSYPSTPKEDLSIPQEHIDSLYAVAYQMYSHAKYKESADLFRLVLMIDRENYTYNFGLAACLQMLEKYRQASVTYMMSAFLDPENPMPHYHCAECYVKLKDTASAVVSLTLVIKLAGDNPDYELLKERCKLTKAQLINRLKERKRKNRDKLINNKSKTS